jgi:hypothetical protein
MNVLRVTIYGTVVCTLALALCGLFDNRAFAGAEEERGQLFGNPRGGYPFEDRATGNEVLIGLRVTLGHIGPPRIIKSIEPIYSAGMKSKTYGKPSLQVLEVRAKPGYAVGGIKVRSGKRIDGMRVIFFRQSGDRLLPDDRYESRWLGGYGGPNSGEILSQEKPVIGVHGRAGDDLDAIGLIEMK